MLNGFKQFLLRGNVVDMSVGVVVGGAFATVASALTKDLLTPLIAAVVGKPDFSAIKFTVNGSVFALGDFLNAVISFLLVAAAVYYLVIVPLNAVTTEGPKLIRRVISQHARDLEDALSCLDHAEKQALANLLRKLDHAADARSAGKSSIAPKEQADGEASGNAE